MKLAEDPKIDAVCTVSQMARILKLSRPRFYQLVGLGVFPPPAYCCSTRKPLYPSRLQEVCIHIRMTGIGLNGQYVRFYSKRTIAKQESQHHQLRAILREMGLSVSVQQLTDAARQLDLSLKNQTAKDPESIRELFIHLHGECGEAI